MTSDCFPGVKLNVNRGFYKPARSLKSYLPKLLRVTTPQVLPGMLCVTRNHANPKFLPVEHRKVLPGMLFPEKPRETERVS